jgi:hypothetical protein
MTTCNFVPGCVEEAEWYVITGGDPNFPEDLLDEPCCETHKDDALHLYGYEALYRIGVGPALPEDQLWAVNLVIHVPYTARVRAKTDEDAMRLAELEVPLDALKEYGALDGYEIDHLVIKAISATEV